MDQRIVAGLGNIYVSEALFRAGLSPNRAPAASPTGAARRPKRAKRLVAAIEEVLSACDRCRRIDAERLSGRQWRVGCFPKCVRRLRSRGSAVPAAGVRRRDKTHGACRARELPLFAVSALKQLRHLSVREFDSAALVLIEDEAQANDRESAGEKQLVGRPVAFKRREFARLDQPDHRRQ